MAAVLLDPLQVPATFTASRKHGRDYGAPLAGSAGSWCTYGVTNLESLLPELGAAYCCND